MKLLKTIRNVVVFYLVAHMIFVAPPDLSSADLSSSQANVLQESDTSTKDSVLIFDNAEIRDVLRLLAEEYDLNIVMSDEVSGTVTLRLKGATLVNTLDAILLARGFDYEIRDNIIRVAPAQIIEAERNQRVSKQELEPLVSEVITLHYVDANDIKSTVKAMLTSRGTVSAVERRQYKGFQFGAQGASTQTGTSSSSLSSTGSSGVSNAGSTGALIRSRSGDETPRSNTLMVVDVRSQIERIKEVISKIDVPPRQVLIDAIILEVDNNTLDDLGIDFNNDTSLKTDRPGHTNQLRTDLNTDSSSTGINTHVFTNTFPTNTDGGLHTFFQKLNGEDLTVVLHALLQDQRTKTLSSPRILTMENQEAAILVGEQFPILEANVSDQGTTTESLSFYQPVGISLQVIAQVTGNDDISMIIHPTVSSVGAFVTGTTKLQQPRINIREADTRVLIRNGETLVIGGLLADVADEKDWRLPLVGDLPFVGRIFTRRQKDVQQRNLLIFITPKIIVGTSESMSESERLSYQGAKDPDSYGFSYDRSKVIDDVYGAAKKNYKKKRYDLARSQFLKVLTLDPHHQGAIKYLKKMDALPAEKPLG